MTLGMAVAPVAVSATHPAPAYAYAVSTYANADGYDTCEGESSTLLNQWWSSTPWYHIGLYLGGDTGQNKGCYDGPGLIDTALNIGYGVVPFWYGPQLPSSCGGNSPYSISLNTSTAYTQGRQQADAAASAAHSANLPTNGLIYMDLEGYLTNSGCEAAANQYVTGWTYEMRFNTAFAPGVYGSTCSSHVADWSKLVDVPDDVSTADYNDVASAYNLLCLSNSLWSHNQRIAQFSQSDSASYGGSPTEYFDEECADGSLITPGATTYSGSCSDIR